jgi:sugar phosphate isomerase/epimerase
MKYAISEITSLGWDFERDVRHYAEAGARAITVVHSKIAAYGREAGRKLLASSGLEVAAYASLGPFALHEPERWDEQLETCRSEIAFAAELGAPIVEMLTGSGRGRPYDETEAAFLRWLERLLPVAERAGVVLAFENNHALRVDLGFIHQLHDALDLAEKVDSPHLRVCCEINNAWIERFLYKDIAERSQLIGIIQLSDFAEGTLCTPQRVPPGDGIIPLRRILTALERAHWPGYLELELVGPDIERMGYPEAIRRSIAFLKGFQPLEEASH